MNNKTNITLKLKKFNKQRHKKCENYNNNLKNNHHKQ